jgi:hypothetical protein
MPDTSRIVVGYLQFLDHFLHAVIAVVEGDWVLFFFGLVYDRWIRVLDSEALIDISCKRGLLKGFSLVLHP